MIASCFAGKWGAYSNLQVTDPSPPALPTPHAKRTDGVATEPQQEI